MTQPVAIDGINANAIDRFTFVHAAVGGVCGASGLPFPLVAFGAVGWELVERPLKDRFPNMFPHSTQDTTVNALFDALAVMGGWWLGHYLRYKAGGGTRGTTLGSALRAR